MGSRWVQIYATKSSLFCMRMWYLIVTHIHLLAIHGFVPLQCCSCYLFIFLESIVPRMAAVFNYGVVCVRVYDA